MKVIVVHGEDYEKSQARIDKFIEIAKTRAWEIQKYDGGNTQSLGELISAESLFTKERIILLKDIKHLTPYVTKFITDNQTKYNSTVIIYSDKVISQTVIKALPQDTKIEEFKLPVLIWKFLDSFYPGNSKYCLNLLRDVLKNQPVEFIFQLLSKQLRDIYWVKSDLKSFPDKGWKASKLLNIAKRFTIENLRDIINNMAQIDVRSKTSGGNLSDLLEFLIISKLKLH